MGNASLTISDLNYGSWQRAGGTLASSVTTPHLHVNLTWIRKVWTCSNTLKMKRKSETVALLVYLQIPESRGGSQVQSDKKFCSILEKKKPIKKRKEKNTDHLCWSFESHSDTRRKEAAAVCAQQRRAAVTNASFHSFRSDAGLWGMSATYPRRSHIYHMIGMKGTSYLEKYQRQAIKCLNN